MHCLQIKTAPLRAKLSQGAVPYFFFFFRLFISIPTCLGQMSYSCSSWAAKLEDSGQGANKKNLHCII